MPCRRPRGRPVCVSGGGRRSQWRRLGSMVSSTPPSAAGFEPDAVWCLRRPCCRRSGTQELPTVVVCRSAAASRRLYGRFRAGRTVRAHPAGFRDGRGGAESSSPPFAATRAAAVADRLPFASSRLGRDARRRCTGSSARQQVSHPAGGALRRRRGCPGRNGDCSGGRDRRTGVQAGHQALRQPSTASRRPDLPLSAARWPAPVPGAVGALSARPGLRPRRRALLGDQPTRSIGDSAGLPGPGRGAGLCFAGEGVEAAPVELPATGESRGVAASRRPAPRAFCAAPTTRLLGIRRRLRSAPRPRGGAAALPAAGRRHDSPPDGCLSGRGRPRSSQADHSIEKIARQPFSRRFPPRRAPALEPKIGRRAPDTQNLIEKYLFGPKTRPKNRSRRFYGHVSGRSARPDQNRPKNTSAALQRRRGARQERLRCDPPRIGPK